MIREDILRVVTTHYLDSGDFNGITTASLQQELGLSWDELRDALQELIEADLVGVLYSDTELNIHILRLGFAPEDVQIAKLTMNALHDACVYPRPDHLNKAVDPARYRNEPYKHCLALGEAQLAFRSFDLSVLELYRNDPRYYYSNDDINGTISIGDQYFETDEMAERDQVLLESFGFAYDQDMNRAVAVYLRYLADLSPEHQQIWKTKELTGDYRLHPDYFRNTILGEWGEKLPIFSAFANELYIINRMADAMERPRLFRRDFGEYGEDRPKKFSFLVRPTLEEFNNFILLLDKLLSDNIDKRFFKGEVSDENERVRGDGKVVVVQKGTLQMLDEWIRQKMRLPDWTPWDESIKAMRDVRQLRQKPAHAVDENVFDQHYFKDQRELIIRAYGALRTLRLLLANHPSVQAANLDINEALAQGEIWTF